ncbi:MAG: methyl-accepting chemotaxis protein [Ignavibacteria bacterium]|jgi:methyl-accepting chemotaxis protein|nr:methyl-accepting chemotaxis protein [Ignavibacteria bacterium]
MKIGVKIAIILILSAIGFTAIVSISIRDINTLNQMLNHTADLANGSSESAEVKQLSTLAGRYASQIYLFQGNDSAIADYIKKITKTENDIAILLDSLDEQVQELQEHKTEFDNTVTAFNVLKTANQKLFSYATTANWDAFRAFRNKEYQASLRNLEALADDLSDKLNGEVNEYVYVLSDKTVEDTRAMLLIIAIFLLVAIIIVSIVIIVGITKSLRKAVKAAEMVAAGDLDGIDLETNSKDETGILLNSFESMINSLHIMIMDIKHISKSAIEGELSVQADASKHTGAYRELLSGVNELVSTLVQHTRDTVKYLNFISKGEIPNLIKEPLPGELEGIGVAINTCISSMTYLVNNVHQLANEASQGKLDYRADASKANGVWSEILTGVNGIVENADNIINDAGNALSIMATGDLTPRISTAYAGKFGQMKDDINNLGDSLTDMVAQLQEAIHTTASASAEISSTAETLAAATQEQSSQTDEVATAMEEMSKTVNDNAKAAIRTANVARNSGEVATNGGQVVQQTVIKMREIATVVQQSADNIAKLGQSSKKIGEIIVVIEDIASQTNLLSLNAAIEAARAGEQGRGFAVVADNVGKLAISTASATKEISDMIKGIQGDTEAAVVAMEKGTSEVHSGIELADNAGNSLKDILAGINELLDMVNQIAAASEQQSKTSEQISKNVSSISKVSGDSARNVEDVATTANELARMTDTLTSLVSQFKINIVGGYSSKRSLER